MRNGSKRSAAAALVGTIILVRILFSSAGIRPMNGQVWWDVTLSMTVRGNYLVKDSKTEFNGEFRYGARWDGTMERDEKDFLLYHIETRDIAWEIQEHSQPPESTHPLTQKEVRNRPLLKLDYILKKGSNLEFAFYIEGISIPLAADREQFELYLPCSCEYVRDRARLIYNDFITRGSNRVSIPEEEIDQSPLKKSFAWEWSRRGWIIQETGAVLVSSRHKAEVVVSLIPHR